MDITLFGVRGSIPNPSETSHFYGSNTSCVEVRTASDDLLIFDAGSGIRNLGNSLPESGRCSLFISHGHRDHTTGLGFFKPFFNPGWIIDLYLPEWHSGLLQNYFDGQLYPLSTGELKAGVCIHIVKPGMTLEVPLNDGNSLSIETYRTNHPGGNVAYKLVGGEVTFLYTGDHEITNDPENRALTRAMLAGTDLAVVDAHFGKKDYKPGWGHSAWEDWLDVAREAGAKRIILSHHAPSRTDRELDALQTSLIENEDESVTACFAREGMRFCPDLNVLPAVYTSNWLEDFINSIGQYKEESVILDTILKKTREVTLADAGTVFLAQDDELVFAYTHNDSLFPVNESSKYAYTSLRLPIAENSIAGYTAVTQKPLNLEDVRHLPEGAPYRFNNHFDEATGYKTVSCLTIPLVDRKQRLMGVMQLINSLHPREKKPQPFTLAMEKTVHFLAREVCKVLELSGAISDNIYRLLRIASLHDPTETGPHAERVGAIASEIYQEWANRNNIPPEEAMHFRSHIRLAAMIHDIGKVGISDNILKKPGRLTEEEFEIIKTHTEKGAELFDEQFQDISELTHDIALHHHQRWDGKGYGESSRQPLKGKEIPLAARITAIADVFDALVSPRCYKEPWPFEKATELIRSEAGHHFDPELAECFLDMMDTVSLIYQRFPENLNISTQSS